MNYRLNSYLSILAIACAVAVPLLSATVHELPVQAALTAPASYDINYRWNSVDDDTFGLGTTSWPTYFPLYTRTSDSTYFNYTTTIDNSDTSILPLGLEITMTFNRSNTSWYSFGGGYLPGEDKIGADATVGSSVKSIIIITNNTSNNYRFYGDYSSTTQSSVINANASLSGITIEAYYIPTTVFANWLIPSYGTLSLQFVSSTSARYFDAWYLKDLGVSDAYDAGYEVGEADGYADGLANNPNVLINAVESLIGMFVNFTFIIFTLEIFGVSILTVVGVLFGIVAITWILKTIRG
jgi:hypothetical protein